MPDIGAITSQVFRSFVLVFEPGTWVPKNLAVSNDTRAINWTNLLAGKFILADLLSFYFENWVLA